MTAPTTVLTSFLGAVCGTALRTARELQYCPRDCGLPAARCVLQASAARRRSILNAQLRAAPAPKPRWRVRRQGRRFSSSSRNSRRPCSTPPPPPPSSTERRGGTGSTGRNKNAAAARAGDVAQALPGPAPIVYVDRSSTRTRRHPWNNCLPTFRGYTYAVISQRKSFAIVARSAVAVRSRLLGHT